ncbi:MAG: hypothetical protein MR518_04210 [Mollicutes bacterium]|nr:hypothetical protein [Mollicutes bacterium]
MNKEFRILNNKVKACGNGTAYDKKTKKKPKTSLEIIWIREYTTQAFEMEKPNRKHQQKKIKLPIDNLNLCMVEFIPRLKRSAYDCSLKTERDDQYIHTRKTSIS